MTSATLPAIRSAVEALDLRLRAVVRDHYDPLWRFLRRMGIPEGQVEDAAQGVLLVFARRAAEVNADAERAFLFGTAIRVASDVRRQGQRQREIPDDDALSREPDPAPDAEEQLGQRELRRRLDTILDQLPAEQRAVFVLAELEELTMAEISALLAVPPGTVASRLRRAREVVEAKALELGAETWPKGAR